MAEQPALDQRGFVGSVIVEHEMDFEMLRTLSVDGVEELSKLDATMTAMVFGDHFSALDVESGKQGGGAVANVVVGPSFDLAWPHGQDGLTRSRAWICGFSSTQSTKARSGGFK